MPTDQGLECDRVHLENSKHIADLDKFAAEQHHRTYNGQNADSSKASSVGQVGTSPHSLGPNMAAGRYLHLHIQSSKYNRMALKNALPSALEFVSGHLASGRTVLIHCHYGKRLVCAAKG